MALLRSSVGVIERHPVSLGTFELPALPLNAQFASISASYSSLRKATGRSARLNETAPRWNDTRQLEQLLDYRNRSSTASTRRAVKPGFVVKALQGAGRSPRRLVDVIRAIPRLSKAYFKSPFRRALYGGISLLGGFYVAQTISLSFGALGVNDVIAAAMCVLFAEYVTRFYYTREKVSFTLALLNNFKMGFTYGLFIDAFKLAS
ncbi:hypothetical protein Mapa_009690 [Marchantia paleacea]|nr:hypothetical protein Mapa_009690 [Marchantia paleacea]